MGRGAGCRDLSLSAPGPRKGRGRPHSRAHPLPPGFAPLLSFRKFAQNSEHGQKPQSYQLHTTASVSMESVCIIKCPKVVFKGFNYILAWRDCTQADVRTIRISSSHQSDGGQWPKANPSSPAGGTDQTSRVLAPTSASDQPPGSRLSPAWPEAPEAPAPAKGRQWGQLPVQSSRLKPGRGVVFYLLIHVPVFSGNVT